MLEVENVQSSGRQKSEDDISEAKRRKHTKEETVLSGVRCW